MLKSVEFRSDTAPWKGVSEVMQLFENAGGGYDLHQRAIVKQYVLAHLGYAFSCVTSPGVFVCKVTVSGEFPCDYARYFSVADRCVFYVLDNGDLWIRPSAPDPTREFLNMSHVDCTSWVPGFKQAAIGRISDAHVTASPLPTHGFVTLVSIETGVTYRLEVLLITRISHNVV